MGHHRNRICVLSDCYANTNCRCTMLDVSIQKDCPFYKIGDMDDVERYADIKAYKYALDRIKALTETTEQKRKAWKEARGEWHEENLKLTEAKHAKDMIKRRIKKRIETQKLDSN